MIHNVIDPDAALEYGCLRVYQSTRDVTGYPTEQDAVAAATQPPPIGIRYELVTRIPGGDWQAVPLLPALQVPCPDCTSSEGQEKMRTAWEEWVKREQAVYNAYVEAHTGVNDTGDSWTTSKEYVEIYREQPDPPGSGCVECDWRGFVLTQAGRQLFAFARTWMAQVPRG